MPFSAGRGHEALRRGRWSSPGAEYFLTLCSDKRRSGLAEPSLVAVIHSCSHQLTDEGHWRLHSATVMPDHLHLLITLGEESELSPVIRLFKGRLAPALRASRLRWQQGCFDHRLRFGEDRLPIFLYIFLNAYRANLVKRDQPWSGYFCAHEDWQWFGPLTDASCPYPAWLAL